MVKVIISFGSVIKSEVPKEWGAEQQRSLGSGIQRVIIFSFQVLMKF